MMVDLLKGIEQADTDIRIEGGVVETPLEETGAFSEETGTQLMFKSEHLQRTGSFKMRGAMNAILNLDEDDHRRGIITASSGNHGMATAQAARVCKTTATIYLPENVSPIKLANIKRLGADTVLIPGSGLDAELAARQAAIDSGRSYIAPYSHPDVMAGQGTIGAELHRQCPDLAAVFICVGGGGMTAGIGTWLKKHSPQTDIVACWPENAAAMYHCLEKGEIYDAQETDTLSDGSAGGIEQGAHSFPICQQVIDRKVLINEEDIASAVRRTAETERYMIEGAAGVAVAAALQCSSDYRGKKIAAVICGRNISLSTFQSILAQSVS